MIYASDWAIGCLTPMFDLPGIFNGNPQTIPAANVVEAELMSFLNKNTAQLKYNLNEWYSLDSAIDCNVYVHYLRGNYMVNQNGVNVTVLDRPLAIYHNVGVNGGKFIYTTFRNESPTTADVTKILQFYVFQE